MGISMTMDRSSFAPGEKLLFEALVTNPTDVPVVFKLTLVQYLKKQVTTRWQNESLVFKKRDSFLWLRVGPGQTASAGTWDNVRVPHAQPSFFGAPGAASTAHEPLQWSYVIEATLRAPGPLGSQVQLTFPVLISACPPYAEYTFLNRDERPKWLPQKVTLSQTRTLTLNLT
uniref:Arrestin C-terminal-like domain-containing protein n=1 Tax=Phaeomonas parva TaxID=124430 RepID=A0A6U4CEC0_9STRA|mmetsp:Transcript_10270/g.30673  ORF Transcript_10270/g.30673 Transcript_10270/m.30673 type:complete len:172 (+) Transcript_10270:1216-1731(+)